MLLRICKLAVALQEAKREAWTTLHGDRHAGLQWAAAMCAEAERQEVKQLQRAELRARGGGGARRAQWTAAGEHKKEIRYEEKNYYNLANLLEYTQI